MLEPVGHCLAVPRLLVDNAPVSQPSMCQLDHQRPFYSPLPTTSTMVHGNWTMSSNNDVQLIGLPSHQDECTILSLPSTMQRDSVHKTARVHGKAKQELSLSLSIVPLTVRAQSGGLCLGLVCCMLSNNQLLDAQLLLFSVVQLHALKLSCVLLLLLSQLRLQGCVLLDHLLTCACVQTVRQPCKLTLAVSTFTQRQH